MMLPEKFTRSAHRLLLVPLVLVWGMAGGEAWAEERFAVVIGANAGWANDKPLRYAEADAQRVGEVLMEVGGFAADRVYVLKDPDTAQVRATLRNLERTLRGLGRQSLVVVYYSGHADQKHLHLRGAPLSHEELRETLRALPATLKLGVVDACRSGSILSTKGASGEARFELEVVDGLKVEGLALMTSSGADELSQETRALAGSVFTHHLVSGLRGAADVDGDGAVSLPEVYQYAYQRTEADTAPTPVPHRPGFRLELTGRGEAVLARLRADTSRLVVPRGEGQRYVVVDEHEVRLVAEVRARPEGPVALALAPGRYLVKRLRASRLEVAQIEVAEGAQVEAEGLPYAVHPLAGGLLKGRPKTKDVEDFFVWSRGEGLQLLAAGEAGAALSLFEKLLAERPDDEGSRRGKARALVRLAEVHDRLGDRQRERQSLREALRADPSLAQDPDFQSWLQRMNELEVLSWQEDRALRRVDGKPPEGRRREGLRWGLGVDLIGPRGMLAVSATLVLREHWFTHLAVDLTGPGLDMGVRYVPRETVWSSFFGAGAHLSFAEVGVARFQDLPLFLGNSSVAYGEIWGKSLHAEGGLQYVSRAGLSCELSLGMLFYARRGGRSWSAFPMLGLGTGWFFGASP